MSPLRDQQVLVPVIDRMASATVVCAGDVMLDSFVHGEVSRISPEAPIPVLRIKRCQSMLGGAGNAVRNLVSLGCAVRFFSVTGDDMEGGNVRSLLEELPGTRAVLEREPGRHTPVKTRYLAHGQQLLRTDNETAVPVSAGTHEKLLRAFSAELSAAIPVCSIVLLSDYAKGVLNGDYAQEYIAAARAAGKPVVVDPKGRDFTRYRGATVIKPNLHELGEATGLEVSGDAAQEAASRRLLSDTGADYILLTRGPEGMLLTPANGPLARFPALAREVYDVSGAGDTVAAVLAAALGSGASISEAVEIANIAAGIVVGRAGTAVVERAGIVEEIRSHSATGASSRIFDRVKATQLARSWTESGLCVGFTNGCFDLLHPGHLKVLEFARAHCDRLLVGLNSDQSVKRLKGETRPVQGEVARAQMLASLACVDGVVIFGEDTPEELIRCLRPRLLVKGSEYKREQVAGAELVESWGGKFLPVEMLPGWSTTGTLARLAENQS